MFQRISLSWELSELSPVWIASASGLPVTGPAATLLSWRTIASAMWPESISCGRYAEAKIPVLGSALSSSNRSVHSTRIGDWASTTCTSLSWAKAISALRRLRGPARGVPPRSRADQVRLAGGHDHRAVAAGADGSAGQGPPEGGPGGRAGGCGGRAGHEDRVGGRRRSAVDAGAGRSGGTAGHGRGADQAASGELHGGTTSGRDDGHAVIERSRVVAAALGRLLRRRP